MSKDLKVVSLSLSKEVYDILEDIIKQAKKKGNRISRSALIESLIYDSLKATYIQSQLNKEKKEEN